MGEVLRGHDDRLDRPVALKRVSAEARDPEKALQRFRREARAVARLSHPAIVQVYDWEECEGKQWLVMELLDGPTLADVIAEGPLSADRAVAIGREVASGLAAAHEAGLVHRDLKASNVMLVETTAAPNASRAKILDFGLAKQIEGVPTSSTLTEEGRLVGTLGAMSPEQALGRPVDYHSDLFSLGILFYEMLSGVTPFLGESPVETLARICTVKEKPLHESDPEIPEGLSRLVSRLLEKDPLHRPASASQVAEELGRLSKEPVAKPETEASVNQQTTLFEEEPLKPADVEKSFRVTKAPAGFSSFAQRCWLAAILGFGVAIWGLTLLSEPPNEKGMADTSIATAELPEAERTSYELYQRGMTYLERSDLKGNIDKAITDFQRALVQDEMSAPALAGLAWAYLQDFHRGSQDPQRLQQALAAAKQSVQNNEHLAVGRFSLGEVYFRMGQLDDAQHEFEKALEIEPANGDALAGLGKVSKAREDMAQAEQFYLRAVATQPDNWFYHSYLGTLYFETGRYGDAEGSFLRQLELTPDDFLALSNLGAIHYMEGQLAEAATRFQQALQIKPDSIVYSNIGTIYFAQGLYAQSVSAFEQALQHGGSNEYILWGNLGDACRWAPGKEKRAREAYLRAIQLLKERLAATSRDPNLQTRLELYLAKSGDCAQAQAELNRVENLPSDDGRAWFRRAVAYEVCNRRTDALTALNSALEGKFSLEEVRRDPELLNLRQDLRYHHMASRIQLDSTP